MNKRINKTVLLELALRCKGDRRRFFEELGAVIDPALAQGDEAIITLRVLDPSEGRKNTPWWMIDDLMGIPLKSIDEFFAKYSWKEVRLHDRSRARTHWLVPHPRR
jgi:hypothetical protein